MRAPARLSDVQPFISSRLADASQAMHVVGDVLADHPTLPVPDSILIVPEHSDVLVTLPDDDSAMDDLAVWAGCFGSPVVSHATVVLAGGGDGNVAVTSYSTEFNSNGVRFCVCAIERTELTL